MADKWFAIFIVVISLLSIGIIVGGFVSSHQYDIKTCVSDAEILGVESRWNHGCQLQTENGVWLDEQDYLMLKATDCK